MRKHPKFLRSLLNLTEHDAVIPTDRDLDNEIETLSWYIHCISPLLKSIIRRKLILMFKYKWKSMIKRLVLIALFLIPVYAAYTFYMRPYMQNVIITEKVQEIENDIRMNPIPEANINFMVALSTLESGSSYTVCNGQYWGIYQLGELARKEVGLASMTKEQFTSSQAIQHWAFNEYLKRNYKYLAPTIAKYNIPTIGGIRIGMHLVTVSGLLAAAHLVGQENVKIFLKSNGKIIPKDGNNKPLTDYLQLNNLVLELDSTK